MKKSIFILAFAALVVASVSCRKDEAGNVPCKEANVIESFTTPASTDDGQTKMTYGYSSDESGWGVSKCWNEGDSLIGFVEVGTEYKYFTYRCSEISGETATWTRVPESSSAGYPLRNVSAKLNMAYAPGAGASGFAGKGKLTIAECTGAIACGTGEYDSASGKLDITFTNQVAMICIVSPTVEGVTAIDSIAVTGVYTKASLELSEGSLKLIPDSASAGRSVMNASAKLDENIFIPVLPGTSLKDLSIRFFSGNSQYFYNVTAESAIAAESYRIKDKTFQKMEAEYRIGSSAPVAVSTIQAAFTAANAAKESTTITLWNDVNLTESLKVTNAAAPLTLDLNGRSLVASNTSTLNPAILVNTTGSELTITDNSTAGTGKIDQKYKGTGYSIEVTAGTLNVTGGTVCNSSSTGYGRIAIKVEKANSTVNISGGYIYGGRAIFLGPGVQGAQSVLNVTGGRIEGKYNVITYEYYAAIYVDNYTRATLTGGTVISAKATCIYVRDDKEDIEVVLGSKDCTKVPYLYTSGNTKCIIGSNVEANKPAAYKKFRIYKCWWNRNVLEYPDQLCATVTALAKSITDEYGYTYKYVAEGSPEGGTQPIKDGDTSEWY